MASATRKPPKLTEETALLRVFIELGLKALGQNEFTDDEITDYSYRMLEGTEKVPHMVFRATFFENAYRALKAKLDQSVLEKGSPYGSAGRYQPYRGRAIAKDGFTQELLKNHGLKSQYDLFHHLRQENFGTKPNLEAQEIRDDMFHLSEIALSLGINVDTIEK